MGTRADFYLGRGKDAVWLGSIAWDGYPDGLPDELKTAATAEAFCIAVDKLSKDREDWTAPASGWPWPWENSRTTDYAYAFDKDTVWGSAFGHRWFKASEPEPDEETPKEVEFPEMSTDNAAPAGSKRFGIMLFVARHRESDS